MTAPEILTGPSIRLIVREDAGRWTCVVDAKATGGAFAELSGMAGPSKGSTTRAAAIAHADAWVRRFFGGDLDHRQGAWLSSLAPAQGDLFLEAA